MFKIFLLFSIFLYPKLEELKYDRPNRFDFIKNTGSNFLSLYNMALDKKNRKSLFLITASTLGLILFDKELINRAKDIGKYLGIKPDGEAEMTNLLSLGPFPILRTAKTKSAFLYLIGDGTVHISIMASFYAYGFLKENDKSINIGSQIFEGLIGVALVTQTLKHITGRESPFVATTSTGLWRWFPNQEKYHKSVPKYDAFPSGHLATTMMTVTVLSKNYPNNPYIKPVGYLAMVLLSFQMMNNEVHWASDYPLAIAIGYSFGKIVSDRERIKAKNSWKIEPKIMKNYISLGLKYNF